MCIYILHTHTLSTEVEIDIYIYTDIDVAVDVDIDMYNANKSGQASQPSILLDVLNVCIQIEHVWVD